MQHIKSNSLSFDAHHRSMRSSLLLPRAVEATAELLLIKNKTSNRLERIKRINGNIVPQLISSTCFSIHFKQWQMGNWKKKDKNAIYWNNSTVVHLFASFNCLFRFFSRQLIVIWSSFYFMLPCYLHYWVEKVSLVFPGDKHLVMNLAADDEISQWASQIPLGCYK